MYIGRCPGDGVWTACCGCHGDATSKRSTAGTGPAPRAVVNDATRGDAANEPVLPLLRGDALKVRLRLALLAKLGAGEDPRWRRVAERPRRRCS